MSDTFALVVLPEPTAVDVPTLASACRLVYERRHDLIGSLPVDIANEGRRRAAAIEEYLRGREGHPEAQRAARVLEAAVGAALGPGEVGRPLKTSPAGEILEKNHRHEFRLMAEHFDDWEPLLEESGVSRAAVLRVIEGLRNGEAGGAHVSANSGESEWFTPPEIIAAAREVMGGIDLDPASTEIANTVVGADTIYTVEQDGLLFGWRGRVWLNPPYAQPAVWNFCEKLSEEVASGNVSQACALVNNATDTAWFQRMAEVAAAACFPARRVKFWHPDRVSAPLQGQAVVYFGDNVDAFREVFLRFGFTVVL